MPGIYVHIPFCVKKCAYCDFTSFTSGDYDAYLTALMREIDACPDWSQFDTIFIGGGTPSLIGARRLSDILSALRARFFVVNGAETTVECNPGTVGEGFFTELTYVNRISIGAQASDAGLLKLIGRIHDWHEVESAVADAKSAGIGNINIDLMYALPTQTNAVWRETLTRAVELDVQHVSCYALTLAEGTPICAYADQTPDEEAEMRMVDDAIRILGQTGMNRYEISNYAKSGYECRHNINYWTNGDYLGLGCAAHSHLGSVRWANTHEIYTYKDAECQEVSREDAMFEEMMLGLRMTRGVLRADFVRKYSCKPEDVFGHGMAKLKKMGMMISDENTIRLTDAGLRVQNAVLVELLTCI